VAARFLPGRKSFQPPAINQENIQPAILVEIVECQTATRRFEKVFVRPLSAIDGLDRKAGLLD